MLNFTKDVFVHREGNYIYYHTCLNYFLDDLKEEFNSVFPGKVNFSDYTISKIDGNYHFIAFSDETITTVRDLISNYESLM